jgi:Rrf2 family iron-sulfur cluster assembly transcriptional regulator
VKLGTKGHYAVTAMVDIAYHGAKAPVTLAQIAERQNLSLCYLEQLFAKLRRAHLVRSVRGPGGGYVLTKTACQTSIAAIIEAVEENVKVTRCEGAGEEPCRLDRTRCLTHDLWEALGDHINGFLERVTLRDVCECRLGSDRNQTAETRAPIAAAE